MRVMFGRLFPPIDQHGDRVRHFLPRRLQDLLANQFRRQEALRLIGDMVLGEVSRTFRQAADDRLAQLVQIRRSCSAEIGT